MRDEARQILLTVVILCAAGCAKSDLPITRQNHGTIRQVTDSAIANAPEEKPPKILPETHYAAGMLFERQGQFDRAIFQYRKAVALNANYVVAFHRLGLLQSMTGQHPEAVKSLQRAVALRPDNAVLHNDLGFEWMHAQQWEDAERELRRAIELQPDLATAHINLGMAYAKSARFAESLASFQAVLPEADAYYNLGLMYQGQQRYSEAQEAFRHVLTIEPEFSAAKIQLERLASGNVPPTSVEGVEAVAETPTLERVDDQVPVVIADTLPPITGPEFMEEEHAVECKHEWGTKLADLAAMLTIIDAHKNWARPVDRPTANEEVVAEISNEEFIDEDLQDSPTAAAGQVPADGPVEIELMTPSVVITSEDVVEAVKDLDVEVPVVASWTRPLWSRRLTVEEAQVIVETVEIAEPPAPEYVEAALAVAVTAESAEPPTPCDVESEETNSDDRIAALPPAPITRPMRARNSWAMIEELEAKVVMLRYETKATKKKLVSATWP